MTPNSDKTKKDIQMSFQFNSSLLIFIQEKFQRDKIVERLAQRMTSKYLEGKTPEKHGMIYVFPWWIKRRLTLFVQKF